MPQQNKDHILIFSITYLPFVGGAEVALKEISSRITDYHFDLITAKINHKLSDKEKIGNLTVYRVGGGSKLDKYLYPVNSFLLAKKLNRKYNYKLIWAMLATWAGMAAFVFKIFNRNIKYLLTLQSGDTDSFINKRTWFWSFFYRQIYTRADHIQVISYWLKNRARRYGYQGKISVIPNGVDLDKIQNVISKKQEVSLKKELNISSDTKVVFSASRLVEKNDIATLISATRLLIVNYHLPVVLIIAGGGKLAAQLKRMCVRLKISANVIFLGEINYPEVLKYYSIADVFARPSLSEGQGISFIEAMAAGVPIVATSVGGISDFLEDYQTGLFCQVSNHRDLSEKIKLLLDDIQLRQKIINNGLKLVREKYDWNKISQKMKDIITNLTI